MLEAPDVGSHHLFPFPPAGSCGCCPHHCFTPAEREACCFAAPTSTTPPLSALGLLLCSPPFCCPLCPH